MSLVSASFVARPNRFIVRARLRDGAEVDAHLGDPGRLVDLLLPEAKLRLAPARATPESAGAAGNTPRRTPRGPVRRTAYTVSLVQAASGAWVSVETTRANRLAESLLVAGAVHGVPAVGAGTCDLKREARAGASRFDFRLTPDAGPPLWVEVKSATFVSRGVARFPDAPTARGRRHVEELTQRVREGERAMILFVVQRSDARSVVPFTAIDPDFTAALCDARRAGVLLRAAHFRLDASGAAEHLGALPVRLPAG